jgi:hypothetical protein
MKFRPQVLSTDVAPPFVTSGTVTFGGLGSTSTQSRVGKAHSGSRRVSPDDSIVLGSLMLFGAAVFGGLWI